MDLLARVAANIDREELIRKGERCVVAVSGGLDSMVLLTVLAALAPARRWRLTIAHFNHCLRGRASNGDEALVKKHANTLGLPAVTARGNVRQHARDQGISLEMAARELRQRFLIETARAHSARVIALAHHADDQVELFFLRLFRGAGGQGFGGMKWQSPVPGARRIFRVRPLLDVSRADLAAFARERAVPFREDATNASIDVLRNRVRHRLLPLLRTEYQPALPELVLRAMEVLGAENAAIEQWAEQWLLCHGPTPATGSMGFAQLPVAVQRACLRLQLFRLDVVPDFALVEKLRLGPGIVVCVHPALSVVREEDGTLRKAEPEKHFDPAELRVVLSARGELNFGGVKLRWAKVAGGAAQPREISRRTGAEVFDADRVGDQIILRHWQPGDRFHPIGAPAPVKLQDFFTNAKVPRGQRRELVLAARATGEIFWVEGMRISELFKVTGATSKRLRWEWARPGVLSRRT